MSQAQVGDTVKVHYTGKLDDGTVFDTSIQRDPLQFQLGEGQVIPGFENAVVGMNEGENKTVTVTADKAYGAYHDEMVLKLNRDQLPENLEPEIGQELKAVREDGQTLIVRIIECSDAEVTLDANHPLAGQDLTFDIELIEID
ncbi:peptidylprolyl isomerase [candidate division KSB3 bacterium]|uniref:Peptidyl-prolyl cis-trans isomerase n=1 Tax=candidate division KSB3 bacterium TaxID=2044937 RepID=A0A9D5JZK3_9BACT|nr:peptidylprolyl isomerase [candidate division KSB3 bacterium]MBD3326930.1 peptidylprolyl isomerase [candidate division KSB3 bacterium]